MENIKNLFLLYIRPAYAMSEIIDKGSWLVAAVLVLLVSLAFFAGVNAKLEAAYRIPTPQEFYQRVYEQFEEDSPAADEAFRKAEADYRKALIERKQIPVVGDNFYKFFSFESSGFYKPLLAISIFYVPLAILLLSLFGGIHNASFGAAVQRDYGALATCTLTAYAAAHLPFAVAGILLFGQDLSAETYFAMWLVSGLLFGVLEIFALRTVFGADYIKAIAVVCIAWLAFSLGMYVFRFVSPWLFSPFLLFYGYMYFGGTLRGGAQGIGNSFRQKQNYKRFLHNATVNPKDADAHVQLALIYLQRQQENKALEHLNKAFEIDANEIDANYELGKIARARGELQKALDHFSTVVEQNDKHALSEIWREIGATYLEAGMMTEARNALEKFVERRPVDSEGLYYLGKVLKTQNEPEKAREMFANAVEALQTAPYHRRRVQKKWATLAEKEM